MEPRTLRRLYDAMHRSGVTGPDMLRLDVSFDDYFEFLHRLAPAVSRRAVAERSLRSDFRALATTMAPDARAELPSPTWTTFERLKRVDLARAKVGTDGLRLSGVKDVRGFGGKSLSAVERIHAIDCDTGDARARVPPLRLRSVEVTDSSQTFLRTLLGSTRPRELTISTQRHPVHLTWLERATTLRRLRVSAPLVRGVAALRGAPLESLALADVPLDDELRDTLRALAATLETVSLQCGRSFRPDELGTLFEGPALRRVSVPSFPALREPWVTFAVSHPSVVFDFSSLNEPDANAETMALEETYRGVDIVKCVKRARVSYEVADDLARDGSNDDLEDELKPLAKAARKKVDWRSEGDTLVVRTSELKTARWVIDRALDR